MELGFQNFPGRVHISNQNDDAIIFTIYIKIDQARQRSWEILSETWLEGVWLITAAQLRLTCR